MDPEILSDKYLKISLTMTNERLPISLPKFDKIAFFLNNLQTSETQSIKAASRQRSNSCSLSPGEGRRLDYSGEKVESRKVLYPSRKRLLLKRPQENVKDNRKFEECQPKNELEIVKNDKTFESRCSEKGEKRTTENNFRICKLNKAFTTTSDKTTVVKINVTSVFNEEDDDVTNQFYSVVPITNKRHERKKQSHCHSGQQELLSTVLQMNPDAKQNVSLVRHGSLPPMRYSDL